MGDLESSGSVQGQLQPEGPCPRIPIVPEGAENYAFLAQFVEIPEGVIFTVEYSVRSGMMAAYHHFGVQKDIPKIYHGLADAGIAWSALRTAFS